MSALASHHSEFNFVGEAPPGDNPASNLRIRSVGQTAPEFFSRDSGRYPDVDLSRYRLTIAGFVSRTLQLSLNELQLHFAESTGAVDLGPTAENHLGASVWRGCLLVDVLDFAGVCTQDGYVELIGATSAHPDEQGEAPVGFVSLERLQAHPVVLAWQADGKRLTAAQGAPVAALVPLETGARRIRWLHRINLLVVPPLWVVR
ncbi:MAG TPA: molybdopterin-dependent oxidoreductase [Chthoniobacterales bacterium]